MEYSNTDKVEEVFQLMRKKAVEMNLEFISSELLLYAIIEHDNNDGLDLIKANGTNLGKLRSLLTARFKEIAKETPYKQALPRLTAQMKHVVTLAQYIAVPPNPITASALVHSLAQVTESVAGVFLLEAGYNEPGKEKRKTTSERTGTSATPNLNAFSTDLTVQAQEGKLDPVIGRDSEIKRVIEILARRKKNNPALVGEPGVGKTAIVEGLAIRIARGEVPQTLKDKRILSLDLNSVVAGTQYRGQFEMRMQKIIQELMKNMDIIVFVDEMHTLLGAGGSEGTGDAANIIKPALSRGYVRIIGATTSKEYRQHIEKDGALDRRFQRVQVEEPTLDETKSILEQIKPIYELFHGVKYEDVIPTIVDLTDRYIQDHFFPDKAIDVLDEAGAVGKLTTSGTLAQVSLDEVRQVISKISGVPVTDLTRSERERLKRIGEDLKLRVVGQDEAVSAIASAIKRKRTGVTGDKRPSSFMFVGPTGVGKTELARQLAKYLFDSVNSLIRLDMSEFYDKHTISSLIGSPPGYIGYEEGGGKLSEKVRKKPYSVILLDELEKAHPDILDVLLQILDDGILTDAQGRTVSFKNTIIIMTTNAGTSLVKKKSLGFASDDFAEEERSKNKFKELLKNVFKLEFLNRLDGIIAFRHLDRGDMRKILNLQVSDINPKFKISVGEEAKEWLLTHGYSEENGARPMRRLLQKEVEDRIADILLDNLSATNFQVDLLDEKIQVITTDQQPV